LNLKGIKKRVNKKCFSIAVLWSLIDWSIGALNQYSLRTCIVPLIISNIELNYSPEKRVSLLMVVDRLALLSKLIIFEPSLSRHYPRMHYSGMHSIHGARRSAKGKREEMRNAKWDENFVERCFEFSPVGFELWQSHYELEIR